MSTVRTNGDTTGGLVQRVCERGEFDTAMLSARESPASVCSARGRVHR